MAHSIATAFTVLPVLSTVCALLALALVGALVVGAWLCVATLAHNARTARMVRAHQTIEIAAQCAPTAPTVRVWGLS